MPPAAVLVGSAVVGAVASNSASKRASRAANASNATQGQAVQLQREQQDKIDAFIKKLPEQQAASIRDIAKSFGEITALQEEAKKRRDIDAENLFANQLRNIEDVLQTEFNLSSELLQEGKDLISSQREETLNLVGEDVAANEELRKNFENEVTQAQNFNQEEFDLARNDLRKIRSGELPEGAANAITKVKTRFNNIRANIAADDAGRNRSGLTGRQLATDFAEAASVGNLTGQLRQQGEANALAGARTGADRLVNTGAIAQDRLQQTGGREIANALQPFQAQDARLQFQSGRDRLAFQEQAGNRRLESLTNRDLDTLNAEQNFFDQQQQGAQNLLTANQAVQGDFRSTEQAALSQGVAAAAETGRALGRQAEGLRSQAATARAQASQRARIASRIGLGIGGAAGAFGDEFKGGAGGLSLFTGRPLQDFQRVRAS